MATDAVVSEEKKGEETRQMREASKRGHRARAQLSQCVGTTRQVQHEYNEVKEIEANK